MALLLFLGKVIVISTSGVMAPGPVTAAAISYGRRSKYAGIAMAIGHGIIEIPLIFLLMVGLDVFLKYSSTQIAIGLVGGAFLLWMGWGMLRDLRKPLADPMNQTRQEPQATDTQPHWLQKLADSVFRNPPLRTGFVLSAGNPYFLFWWATVGLNLAIDARELGWLALVIFALVHWMCDVVWLLILTWASFKGTHLLKERNQKIILGVCATALILFGAMFLYDAVGSLVHSG